MPKRVSEVMSLLKRVTGQNSILHMLMEMEKTLDNANLYAYQNWMCGELVDGPVIDRYWFTVTLMYPEKLMPDPDGALRLVKYGCKVYFKKDTFLEPTKVLGPTDLRSGILNPRKQAKLLEQPVWLVVIEMPRKFVDEAQDALLGFEDNENIDIDDINAAWDEGLDNESASKEEDVDADEDAREAPEMEDNLE